MIKFFKLSKKRKQEKHIFKLSDAEQITQNFMLTGEIDKSIPIELNINGDRKIVDFYLWSSSNLFLKKKKNLHKMCKKYGLKLTGSKNQLVEILMKYREHQMEQHIKNTMTEQLNCNIENLSTNSFQHKEQNLENNDLLEQILI